MTDETKSSTESAPAKLPTSQPADTGPKTSIDHNNPGRHVLRSKGSERALTAQVQLSKLTESGMKDLPDKEVSQLAKDLGLQVRGTGAKGDVTREDYIAALKRRLPAPAKGKA